MTGPLAPWDRAAAAVAVLAVDPVGVKGLWLRARAGPVRDQVVQALPPTRRIHPGIDDTALYGGVDLTATLATGQLRQSAGLFAGTGGLTLLGMAERCPPGLAARLARWLDGSGGGLITLDEGAEADELLPGALADRLGLFLDLSDVSLSETAPLDPDPARLDAARARLAGTGLPPDALARLTGAAAALGIDSLRAPLLALRIARALAAWRDEAVASEDSLRHAAELALAHRAAPPAPEQDSATPPPAPDTGDQTPPEQDQTRQDPPEDLLLDAVRAALPGDLLARLFAGRAARSAKGSGGSGAARKGNHRGRPLPPRPGLPGAGRRIDLVATLRAAAPWQRLRRQTGGQIGDQTSRGAGDQPDSPHGGGSGRLAIRAADLRIKRYQQTSDRVLIFAVDASGSAAMTRLAEAKGAVELLLARAYARRDHVALIAFRGQSAELLLPPTRSLVQTKRRLSGLPGGGGTPLAAGLRLAFELGLQTRARGMTPTLALLTDGRGNVALDGSPNRDLAETEARQMCRAIRSAGIPALVIDIANRPQMALERLARDLDALYLPLPRADAGQLSAVLHAALVP